MKSSKFNKIYIPVDAVARHEDFDTWYEDGELFLRFQSKKGWSSEKDQVQIIGRMGGQVGLIRPDAKTLNYFIRYERYEYILHTYVIEEHYYVEGMLWDVYAKISEPPFDFFAETVTSYTHKDVHVKLKEFKDRGLCYEVHVPDLAKLRIAVAALVAMAIKEEWKGLSEGEEFREATWLRRLKSRVFEKKGFSYEEIKRLKEEGSPHTTVIRQTGRPCDKNKKK